MNQTLVLSYFILQRKQIPFLSLEWRHISKLETKEIYQRKHHYFLLELGVLHQPPSEI
ncbi:hypothetical protein LguiA_026814 [Lonicera macranthoides]